MHCDFQRILSGVRAVQSTRRYSMLDVRIGLIVAGLCLPGTASAQTEIHRCTDADGGVAYSQLPCVAQESAESKATETEEKADVVVPVSVRRERLATETKVSQDEPDTDAKRAACKKRYRDAIDVIDAEIGREYTPEKADQYKKRLLALTGELRKC